MKDKFKKAHHTGIDVYSGEGVDVVGDAHLLSTYFQDKKFDLIFSSAVFEHLAMPWRVAEEIRKLLKIGGYVFIETHYSYSAHERPWHFFQYSDLALKILFSREAGFRTVEVGVSNPINGVFSEDSSDYLKGKEVPALYCHSEYFGQKIEEANEFSWDKVNVNRLVEETNYPKLRKEDD